MTGTSAGASRRTCRLVEVDEQRRARERAGERQLSGVLQLKIRRGNRRDWDEVGLVNVESGRRRFLLRRHRFGDLRARLVVTPEVT